MSEIVVLDAIKTALWLLFFSLVVHKFQNEIKGLIQSLSSLEVAGATFELKNKKETIRSYILLSETLVELISRCEDIEKLVPLIDASESEKLGSFALKYTSEVPKREWNIQLLRNIAHLLIRHGRYQDAIDICGMLLSQLPENYDLLNLKALALMTSRIAANFEAAEVIFSNLVSSYPEITYLRYNLALVLSLQQKFEESEKQMSEVIDIGFGNIKKDLLQDPLFHHFREQRPNEFKKLESHLKANIAPTTI